MSDQLRSTLTMVDQIHAALELVLPGERDSAPARLAVMYAEAIDDDDEGDGLFRFGPRLFAALETMGLVQAARAGFLPQPMVGRLRPAEPTRHLSAVGPLCGEVLAA